MTRRPAQTVAGAWLLAAAVCCLGTTAFARSPVASAARAVAGGGSFDEAPLLGAGEFTDTLLPRETLFYAIRLRAGQHLRVTGTVDLTPGSRSHGTPDAAGGFALTLFSPLRQRLPTNDREDAPDEAVDEDFAIPDSEPVSSFARAAQRATDGEDWSGPGLYHVVAAMSATRRDLGALVEFPLRLRVQIDDRGPAGASLSATGPLDAPVRAAALAVRVRGAGAVGPASEGASSDLKVVATIAAMLLGALIVACALAVWERFARPP